MRLTRTVMCLVAPPRKRLVGALTVACALAGVGCGADGGPITATAPSPTVIQGTPPPGRPDSNVAGDRWRLSTTVVSVEGSACFWTHPVGKTFADWTLAVERNGAEVRFVYDVNNPHDNVLFVGKVNGQGFTAASDTYSSFWQCSGNVTFSSSLAGSFSVDGQTLSGRERMTYRIERGGEVTITLEWSATPRRS